MTALHNLRYHTLHKGRSLWGKLDADVIYNVHIYGHDVEYIDSHAHCKLNARTGKLIIMAGTEWDFGTGALNTPEMVRASLIHDMLCHLTNAGLIPYKYRRHADRLFLNHLKMYGPRRPWYHPLRYWKYVRFAGVTINSQTLARWRAKKYETPTA